MIDIQITPETITALIVFLTPVVAFIITYLKKKLGYAQGDMAFEMLNQWVAQAQALADNFPELIPYTEELAETVAHAQALWANPNNNSAELAQVYAHASVLIAKIYELVKKYSPPAPVQVMCTNYHHYRYR
jgi:hypothetical protein